MARSLKCQFILNLLPSNEIKKFSQNKERKDHHRTENYKKPNTFKEKIKEL